MMPTTPTGSRVISASELLGVGAISSYTLSTASPYQRMQLAALFTSTDRAYFTGLPMSSVSVSASSSACASNWSANLIITRLRCAGAMPLQRRSSNAARAAATAASMSA